MNTMSSKWDNITSQNALFTSTTTNHQVILEVNINLDQSVEGWLQYMSITELDKTYDGSENIWCQIVTQTADG